MTSIICVVLFSKVGAIEHIRFYDDGAIQYGQYYDWVYTYNNATVNMTGGLVIYNVETHDSSTFNISGGEIGQAILSLDTSTVNISGGLFDMLSAEDSSTMTITGGLVTDNVGTNGSSVLNVWGGEFQAYISSNFGSSRINIFGYGFAYNPLAGKVNRGQLTGYWGNGTPFKIDFNTGYDFGSTYYDHVVLHEIPEPCTLSLLAMGGFVLLRKRRA